MLSFSENRQELNDKIFKLSFQICGSDKIIKEKIAGYIALRIDDAIIEFNNNESSMLLSEEEYENEIEKIRTQILSDVILDNNKEYSIDNLTDAQAIKVCNSLEKELGSLQKEKLSKSRNNPTKYKPERNKDAKNKIQSRKHSKINPEKLHGS
jgi:hypothetical protein